MRVNKFTHIKLLQRLLRAPFLRLVAVLAASLAVVGLPSAAYRSDYAGASVTPKSQIALEPSASQPDASAPEDEAQGGRTSRGTPVAMRSDDSFPAESRNLFAQVDKVATGPGGALEPFDYTDGKNVTVDGELAIKGQNTWMLWGGGNESFWGWLQENNYGLVDFLVLLDSRTRDTRFKRTGLINQPGMKTQKDSSHRLYQLLGLYLDQADGESILLGGPEGRRRSAGEDRRPFEPGNAAFYDEVVSLLPRDGVNPAVYGYPSGIVGLRLWPNPDFFGNTPAAAAARAYWARRVIQSEKPGAFYTELDVHADPELVRPFRVSMSCGFCHVGPHPLSPPANPEKPEWGNLSSTIGNQYWRAGAVFANLAKHDNFLYHFLMSEQPGTVETSLISTDHINNPNTIIAIFDVPARLERAKENPAEEQSAANQLAASVWQSFGEAKRRHVPRVILDGADSIGVTPSLSRVYVNIGTFSEQWRRLHNPVIGFQAQKPFSVVTLRAKSAYWRTTENDRVLYLKHFFTYKSSRTSQSITAPMKLADTKEGKKIIDENRAPARRGRQVFLEHCAICHSSKQPRESFEVTFSRQWDKQQSNGDGPALTLPMDFADWEEFKKGAAYKGYVSRITSEAGAPEGSHDEFLKDNFLSTDIRVPVTLVGTNSARAVATNAMKGQVWDNFSSETYKRLPAVGPVRFYNPYSGHAVDQWGNNAEYKPPAGGPGYYRPASLISIWATAPYLHNNTLGTFSGDPSVQARLEAFEDGIDKLLSRSKRVPGQTQLPGALGASWRALAGDDPGFIYRTPDATSITFPRRFIRPLIEGVVGESAVKVTLWVAYGLVITLGLLTWAGRPRWAGYVLIVIATLITIALAVTRVDRVHWWLWAVPLISAFGAIWFWGRGRRPFWARIVLGTLGFATLVGVVNMHQFLNGTHADLRIGPIPPGTPVNLLMNINPHAPAGVLVDAISALTRGILLIRRDGLEGEAALAAFEKEAGLPLLEASKCPDFVLDRGHWFGETLTKDEKDSLKAFLRTL